MKRSLREFLIPYIALLPIWRTSLPPPTLPSYSPPSYPPPTTASQSQTPHPTYILYLCAIPTPAPAAYPFITKNWLFNSRRQPLNGYYLGALLFSIRFTFWSRFSFYIGHLFHVWFLDYFTHCFNWMGFKFFHSWMRFYRLFLCDFLLDQFFV